EVEWLRAHFQGDWWIHILNLVDGTAHQVKGDDFVVVVDKSHENPSHPLKQKRREIRRQVRDQLTLRLSDSIEFNGFRFVQGLILYARVNCVITFEGCFRVPGCPLRPSVTRIEDIAPCMGCGKALEYTTRRVEIRVEEMVLAMGKVVKARERDRDLSTCHVVMHQHVVNFGFL